MGGKVYEKRPKIAMLITKGQRATIGEGETTGQVLAGFFLLLPGCRPGATDSSHTSEKTCF